MNSIQQGYGQAQLAGGLAMRDNTIDSIRSDIRRRLELLAKESEVFQLQLAQNEQRQGEIRMLQTALHALADDSKPEPPR